MTLKTGLVPAVRDAVSLGTRWWSTRPKPRSTRFSFSVRSHSFVDNVRRHGEPPIAVRVERTKLPLYKTTSARSADLAT